MRRILFIGNFLSRSRGTISPTERVIRKLKQEGIICLSASHFENRLLRLCHMLAFCLFARFDKLHADTFSYRSFTFARLATRIAQWRGKPVILNLHGGKLPQFYDQHPGLVASTFHRATRLISPSRYLVNFFAAHGFNVQYLPNFIDLQQFDYKIPTHPNRAILWVRAFSAIYHPETAIQILALLKKKYPDVTLNMAGPDLGLQANCEQHAERLGIRSSVQFPGTIQNENLPELYHSHGVFLNTTVYESFGMALMEAAACGIPIVSSSVGEIPLLWEDGKDMLLVADLRPETYANSIAVVFDNPSTSLAKSAAARQKAEAFGWKTIQKQWFELLQ